MRKRMAWRANLPKNHGMKIGAVIREIRQAKGLTLEEVAYAAGTDGGNLSRIERGLQRCVHEVLEGIASGLGMTVAELYLQAEAMQTGVLPLPQGVKSQFALTQRPIINHLHADLIAQYEKLSGSNQKLVVEFIQMLLRHQRQK